MIKMILKRNLLLMAVMAAVFSTFFVNTDVIFAAGEKYTIDMADTYWLGQADDRVRVLDKDGCEVFLDGMKLGNKSLFKVERDKFLSEDDITHYEYDFTPVKAGKTTVTFFFTTEDKQKKSVSKTVNVKKYPKEIKSLKVNGKKINTSKKAKRFTCDVKAKSTKCSIKLATKKGWKLTKVRSTVSIGSGDWYMNYSKKITKKMLKKGTKFKFPKKYDDLYVYCTMKNSSGDTIDYNVHLWR